MSELFTHGYALLIGVGHTIHESFSLPVTVQDTQALWNVLIDTNLCAYLDDETHIHLLNDEKATRQGIFEGLNWLIQQASLDNEATVLIYYSGHGWKNKNNQKYYLIPHDTDPSDVSGTSLSGEIFMDKLRQIHARRLVVFIDSCHAAGITTSKGSHEIQLPSGFTQAAAPKGILDTLTHGEGRAIFSSSTGEQYSYIRADGTLSLYTYHLIEALRGAGSRSNEISVHLSDLIYYLGKSVPASAQDIGKEQTPFAELYGEDFSVALLGSGRENGNLSSGNNSHEQITIQSLRHISDLSLAQHKSRFSIGHRPETLIDRDVYDEILRSVDPLSDPIILIRGASGTGKSTLLRQVGTAINKRGGVSLWVPAEEITPGMSLVTVLQNTLKKLYSSIGPDAGSILIKFASQIPVGLILLIDDINRLSMPQEALNTISGWISESRDDSENTLIPSGICILLPIWPEQVSNVIKPLERKWKNINLDNYSYQEKGRLAKLVDDIQPERIRTILDILNGDPFLCALAIGSIIFPPASGSQKLVKDLINDFFQSLIYDIAQRSTIPATPNEISGVIDSLVKLAVETGDPEPSWGNIRQELGQRHADLLFIISKSNSIGWISSKNGEEHWEWKHNRLRDALIGRWLGRKVANISSGQLTSEFDPIIVNSGLVEAWAFSLVFLTPSLAQNLVKVFTLKQPVILAEVLRLHIFPQEADFRDLLRNGLIDALPGLREKNTKFVSGAYWWLLDKLSQTHDPLVLEFTDGLPNNWAIFAARTRNGDINACLTWIQKELDREEFLPTLNYPDFEHAVESFSVLYSNRKNIIIDDLEKAISEKINSGAAITLAGYLAWTELAYPVWVAWNLLSMPEKIENLIPIVWALSRCGNSSVQDQLEDCLLLAREISDEEKEQGKASDRYWKFIEPLRLSLRWPITVESGATWAKVADKYEDPSKWMYYLLRSIDQPTTIETYIRWSAEKKGTFWDDLGEPLDPLERSFSRSQRVINPETLQKLWEMFTLEQDQMVRRLAFGFWKLSATSNDLDKLQSIPEQDPFFDEVLKTRLWLRDTSTKPYLLKKINQSPGFWSGYTPFLIEDDDVFEALVQNFEAAFAGDHFRPYGIVRHLPPKRVRDIINLKGDVLQSEPWTWNSVWRSDAPEALSAVVKWIKKADPKTLEHFTHGPGSFPYTISKNMLNALVPVLDHFPETELSWLAEMAIQNDFHEWVIETGLDKLLHMRSAHRWPDHSELLKVFSNASNEVQNGERAVRQVLGMIIYSREDYRLVDTIEVLKQWLGEKPSVAQIIIGAIVIVAKGHPKDIVWWQNIQTEDKIARQVWLNALENLRRLQWQ